MVPLITVFHMLKAELPLASTEISVTTIYIGPGTGRLDKSVLNECSVTVGAVARSGSVVTVGAAARSGSWGLLAG